MTLDELMLDIYALEDELRSYERKYGVLSETFYESYRAGEEPPEDSWVRDWTAWGSAYDLWTRRHDQYRSAVRALRGQEETTTALIRRTARHEPIPVPA
jgi:hypothetical protein